MGSYRKKPVVVEAIEFIYPKMKEDPNWWAEAVLKGIDHGIEVVGAVVFESEHLDERGVWSPRLVINTGVDGRSEGLMIAIPGDWIIRGIKGELYPCNPEIFQATYERADVPNENAAA